MLGEGVGWESRITMPLGTGRKMRPVQSLQLGAGEAEHEIGREAPRVALYLLIEAFGGDAIERGKLGVEKNPLSPQDKNPLNDLFDRTVSGEFRFGHRVS
jgi:hypothetical protein